jgi:thiamine-monophosphate kinase
MRSEFEFIKDIKSRHDLSKVGDDCAVLPKDAQTDLLITSDMLVEGIDFRLNWASPEQIGHKALAVSLSDVAAMGGTPTSAMLSIAVVKNLWKGDFLDDFYEGWHLVAREYGVELIGGDISQTDGPLVIDSTVIAEVPKGLAFLRSGAAPGEAIFVTGTLGRAAGGLRLIDETGPVALSQGSHLVKGLLTPVPQLSIAKSLQTRALATSMIDLSDGLSSDLMHLCEASNVGAEIMADLLPIDPALRSFFTDDECLDMALNGGEDFQLLFTGDPERITVARIPSITRIGTVTPSVGSIELVSGQERKHIEARGYQHF